MAGTKNRPPAKQINLALQGGGAHGAFTWGVLERLMGDRRLRIAGLSGTSAGAMNATVMADGFIKGRRDGAISAIREFWRRVASAGRMGTMATNAWKGILGLADDGWNLDATPIFALFEMTTRMFSPYQLNPHDLNPLRDIIEDLIDFETLRSHDELKLFVTATNVKSGKPRVFRTQELTADVLMASACLPLLFKAIEIDGEYYWDGGYMGNPSIYPLVRECGSQDVVIIQISPLRRTDVPTNSRDILNRVTELSFNSSLVREMRGFATITHLLEAGHLTGEIYTPVNFHMIDGSAVLPQLGVSSKYNTDLKFLEYLHGLGYKIADDWLAENFEKIGVTSSMDVFETFM